MQSYWYHRTLVVLMCAWLCTGALSPLHAQIAVTLNSLADDSLAHPWDDPDTPDTDESVDGICLDCAGRRTIRAAFEEAANMNDGKGVPCILTINLSGNLTVIQTLTPPDGSVLQGNSLVTIQATSIVPPLLMLGNNTTVRGVNFANGFRAIEVAGDGNTIAETIISDCGGGIFVAGNDNTIGRDNYLYGMQAAAIGLTGNNNVVKGNSIGINTQGDTVRNIFGVEIFGDNNTIGGTDPADRNIISGNRISGIFVAGVTGVGLGTTIVGNYIGTDPTGTQQRPNGYGIQLISGSATIGGLTPAERNVISGNLHSGIETRGDVLAPEIIGNYIGTDPSGTLPLANGTGITMSPGSFDCAVDNNLIAYNGTGILIAGTSADPSWNHRIRGNKILHSFLEGIVITGTATDIVIGSSLTQNFEPNEIHSNGTQGFYGYGVLIVHGTSAGTPRANTIRKNDFRDNLTKGIVLNNGVQDDIQPPTIQNYTDLGNGQATITVTHHRSGSLIDVYVGQQTVLGQEFEGGQWLGSGIEGIDTTFTFSIGACNCAYVVATATDQAENTSEFSAFAVSPLPITLLSFTGVAMSGNRVRLDWTTLTETNNYGFEIQRSQENESNYGTLPNSFIPGHGTTIEPQYYTYIDSTAFPGHWYYRLRQIDLDGAVHYSDGRAITILTGVPEAPLPDKFALNQNYPNPFNPTTTIRFAIPVGTQGHATLRVFDVVGREVRTLVNEELQAGNHERTFDADGLAGGVYFYTLSAGGFVQTRKLLLLR